VTFSSPQEALQYVQQNWDVVACLISHTRAASNPHGPPLTGKALMQEIAHAAGPGYPVVWAYSASAMYDASIRQELESAGVRCILHGEPIVPTIVASLPSLGHCPLSKLAARLSECGLIEPGVRTCPVRPGTCAVAPAPGVADRTIATVLSMSGSFAPPHDAHLGAMDWARAWLEANYADVRGRRQIVVGGSASGRPKIRLTQCSVCCGFFSNPSLGPPSGPTHTIHTRTHTRHLGDLETQGGQRWILPSHPTPLTRVSPPPPTGLEHRFCIGMLDTSPPTRVHVFTFRALTRPLAAFPVFSAHDVHINELPPLADRPPSRRSFLCPSSEDYVNRKLGAQSISADDRVALCELAVRSSPWLDVCDFCTASSEMAAHAIEDELRQAFPAVNWNVLEVFGADHIEKVCAHARSLPQLSPSLCPPRLPLETTCLLHTRTTWPVYTTTPLHSFGLVGGGIDLWPLLN